MYNKLYSAGIFIDQSKAFDTVDHLIVLRKLEHYGIRVMPREWFQNYFSSRQQFVSINCDFLKCQSFVESPGVHYSSLCF